MRYLAWLNLAENETDQNAMSRRMKDCMGKNGIKYSIVSSQNVEFCQYFIVQTDKQNCIF